MEKIYKRWLNYISEEELKGYERFGFGQRVGLGEKPCLLIVDLNNVYTKKESTFVYGNLIDKALNKTSELLKECRKLNIPVIYVRSRRDRESLLGIQAKKWGTVTRKELHTDNCYQFDKLIEPQENDIIIEKSKPSAFFNTTLENDLKFLKIDTLIICGTSTSGCVRSTVMDAFYRDYHIIVPEECCGDRSKQAHINNLFDIDMKYGDVMNLDEVINLIKGEYSKVYEKKLRRNS